MHHLLEILDAWKPFAALVVGDFMLDQLWFGDADRLSADAPVPVLHVRRTEDRPGGAANVCLDLAALGGRVTALGVVGDDEFGGRLAALLKDAGVDLALHTDPERPTTIKRNLIGLAQHRHPQKMFRIDTESHAPIAGDVLRRVLASIDDAVRRADVVCIEDYGKGVCTAEVCRAVIDSARKHRKPVLVDPSPAGDPARYAGATAITPNRTEAARALHELRLPASDPAGAAAALVDRLSLDAVVVTLDREGALLLEAGGRPTLVPTRAREVYDVTGAGDMVLAALAAARANSVDWPHAVELANVAAGLEIEVLGVVPIPLHQIRQHLRDALPAAARKLLTLDELHAEVQRQRASGRSIVFTNGCFDVLHSGHVRLIEEAAAQGDFLIVAVNDDDGIRRAKGPQRPINTERDRVTVLASLEPVDALVVFSDPTPRALIERLRPDVLVKGAEYALDQIPGADFVRSIGGRVHLVEMLAGRSTTATLRRAGHPSPEPAPEPRPAQRAAHAGLDRPG